jgi:quercetin dioxygenase-like cupin family protein
VPKLKPSLLFGKDLSLQASERKLLFESALLPIQCWLEQLSCGTAFERLAQETWEEILLIRGQLGYNQTVCEDIYLCLPPEESVPPLRAGDSGAVLLRMMFGSEEKQSSNAGQLSVAHGKVPVEVLDFRRLAWNEIPARRANDPGARIAELSTNESHTRITSLMDCRPSWILDDHDHPSDVLTFCMRGGGILGIDEETTAYEPGHLVTIPAGMRHRFQAGNQGTLLAVFVFEPFLFRTTEYGDDGSRV